ncbi:hypothetical protein LCGC14_1103110 [marine sediment metagenome]|uniref:Serine-threonine/tyrosine-protein kinase catalytic domain-containing protein n=1 Tax=marine sediment metagenome TaxID=412755 RepID=A0A0F9PS37_9ZZZZ
MTKSKFIDLLRTLDPDVDTYLKVKPLSQVCDTIIHDCWLNQQRENQATSELRNQVIHFIFNNKFDFDKE